MWKFNEKCFERLKEIASVISPTTNEVNMADYIRSRWSSLGVPSDTDVMGNIHACVGNMKSSIQVGVAAHIDHPVIQITQILPNGMLRMRTIGLNPHVLLGQRVTILSHNNAVDGVIGFDQTSQFSQPKGLVLDDLWIDIGASSLNEVKSLIEIGDFAVLSPSISHLSHNSITGAGIDNSIGVFILMEIAEQFYKEKVDIALHLIGTAQEEAGLRGAQVHARKYNNLNACFILDVDYATDTPFSHPYQMGELNLGNGVGLHVKADNNNVLRNLAIKLCNNKGLQYQISVGRYLSGGTDATPFQLYANDTAVLNLNIPCRYMHSPIETINIKDVESVVNLQIALIKEIATKQYASFRPGMDDY
jgi:endoglucanase